MSDISTWSTTAASNNSASPNGFPEGMAPSGVNDSAREVMAATREFYENIEWRDWGHTVTRTGATTFTIGSDVTSIYVANRRIKCVDSSTLYGTIASSSYGAPNTTVTVTLDSGSLSASLASVALGPDVTNDPIHVSGVKGAVANTGDETIAGNKTLSGTLTMSGKSIIEAEGANVASASDCNIWSVGDGNTVHLTGTTTVTDWGTAPQAGAVMWVICNAATPFTYNSTTNDMNTNGLDYTANVGDVLRVYAESTSAYKVTIFKKTGELVSGAVTATTSGTSHDYTGIPPWAKKITGMLNEVSTNGSSTYMIQIGDSGGIETSSYVNTINSINQAGGSSGTALTAGFGVNSGVGVGDVCSGTFTLALVDAATYTWIFSYTGKQSTTNVIVSAGSKALSATLDRVRLTTFNGTDTFDAGSFNILYE